MKHALSALAFVVLGTAPSAYAEDEAVVRAARAIMASDPTPTLISLDARGHPRARTVQVSEPDAGFVLWIATRPNTRKVEQLRSDARVTLHYADDDAGAYLSVMGRATLHDDPATIAAHTFHAAADLAAFWPDYPEDYLLIRVTPDWIEVLGAGAEADPETWRPPAFAPRDGRVSRSPDRRLPARTPAPSPRV
ncbi:MAG: pyridoxamine 5'-phosphate oxidase family protein [Pseudomonadales bacterium]|jgi:general stress protein 26|nr:pyridoxamine 5'-phosphate oxidase family protein [Pseudomonadales bacterium]